MPSQLAYIGVNRLAVAKRAISGNFGCICRAFIARPGRNVASFPQFGGEVRRRKVSVLCAWGSQHREFFFIGEGPGAQWLGPRDFLPRSECVEARWWECPRIDKRCPVHVIIGGDQRCPIKINRYQVFYNLWWVLLLYFFLMGDIGLWSTNGWWLILWPKELMGYFASQASTHYTFFFV
jgi:hypothetical protein